MNDKTEDLNTIKSELWAIEENTKDSLRRSKVILTYLNKLKELKE